MEMPRKGSQAGHSKIYHKNNTMTSITEATAADTGAEGAASTRKTLTHADLVHFTGTETWYRHPLNKKVLYTDGAQYVAEAGGAYWLLDEIACAQLKRKRCAVHRGAVQAQGKSSSMRLAGQRLTSLVSTSVSQAFGLTLLSLQVSMSDARHAQFWAP